VGKPVVVTEKVPAVPTVNVVLGALEIAGAEFTVNVKVCVAELTLFVAFSVSEYVPRVPDAGVPASVAVPFPLSVKVTPVGNAPVSVKAGTGKPVVVTVKDPAAPSAKEVLVALVKAGAWFTVSVKDCVASAPAPLCALMVRE